MLRVFFFWHGKDFQEVSSRHLGIWSPGVALGAISIQINTGRMAMLSEVL